MKNTYYFVVQPIVALDNEQHFDIFCYELLLRDQQTHQFPGQAFFSTIGTKVGNHTFLDWVQQALRPVMKTNPHIKFSINFEISQLQFNETFQFLNQLQPLAQQIFIEITERQYDEKDMALARQFMAYAQQLGYRVLFDDVDNLLMHDDLYTLRLADGLKFSQDLIQNNALPDVLRQLTICQEKLNQQDKLFIVEGVNSELQAQRLYDIGIQLQQGYYFGKPHKIEELLV
ncbi:MAG: EAL domain-containing protein [Leuconostoc fallax]